MESTPDTVIGHNVHELLWRRRMTQAPLIQALGLSRSSLQKKLRGQQSWSAADIVAAAEVLGVDPGDLFVVPEQRGTHQYHAPSTGVVVDLDTYRAELLERVA